MNIKPDIDSFRFYRSLRCRSAKILIFQMYSLFVAMIVQLLVLKGIFVYYAKRHNSIQAVQLNSEDTRAPL